MKDPGGALGQLQPNGTVEGGDACAWNCAHEYLSSFKMGWPDYFSVAKGAYCRHPVPAATFHGFGAYYRNPWRGCMSRDQLTPVVAVLAKDRDYKKSWEFVKHHGKSLFLFAYNTIPNGHKPESRPYKLPDLTLFDFWAMELRMWATWSWLFWPVLCVLDIHVLIAMSTRGMRGGDDVISLLMKYFVSRDIVPTPTSWLTSKLIDKEYFAEMLDSYWSGWRKQPGMVGLYVRKLREL